MNEILSLIAMIGPSLLMVGALFPTNPIFAYGNNFEIQVTNAWQKVHPVNPFREGVFFQNNAAAGSDITISKTGKGVYGQGIVIKGNGGYYTESGERDAVTGKIIGVHQGEWWVIGLVAGPIAIETGES